METKLVCELCSQVNCDKTQQIYLDYTDSSLLETKNKLILCFPELDVFIFKKIVLCTICLKTINIVENFKNTCYTTEQRIKLHMEVIVNVYKEITIRGINTNVQNYFNTCRICLNIIEQNFKSFSLDYIIPGTSVSVKNKLYLCFPELDLRIVPNSIICQDCLEIVDTIFCFRNQCFSITERIKKYLENINSTIKSDVVDLTDSGSEDFTPTPHFDCFQCNFSTKVKRNIRNHVLTHIEKKKFKCPKCEYHTNYKNSLKSHFLFIHTSKKSFECIQCNYCCKRKVDLEKHIRVHELRKPFVCLCSNFSSVYKSKLMAHIVSLKCKPINSQNEKY